MTASPEELLSARFIEWVEAYAKRVCPEGCLPSPAQEREISLFAEMTRAVMAKEASRVIAAVLTAEVEPGEINGLYGRIPPIFQKLVRKISDASNYDFAAMELLDAFEIEWRKP